MLIGIGIDLGTTYSCVIHRDGSAERILANALGEELTPSVVYFGPDDSVVVGAEAKAKAAGEPDSVVTGIKRQMGREYPLEYYGKQFTPESISALILRQLAADAAAGLGVGADELAAVVTVPAHFGTAEKEATYAASTIAGLRCLELLAEPVAAAYAYGLSAEPHKTSLVFDLGGGTFDVAVVGMDRGRPRVWAVDGDTKLGGIDWDQRILDLLLEQAANLDGWSELRYDEDVIATLESAAEVVKRKLTGRDRVSERIRLRSQQFELRLTRAEFEASSRDLVAKCLDTVERVRVTARGQGAPAADQVLLVGGSTRMPMVREALSETVGLPVLLADPDRAVARGAAILATQLVAASGPASRGLAGGADLARITPVLPRAIGILIHSSAEPWRSEPYVQHFLPANAMLPIVDREHTVATVIDNQSSARIQLYEQGGSVASPAVADNRIVLEGEIVGIPPRPAGSPLMLQVSVDLDGRIRVRSHDGKRTTLEVEAFIHGVLDDAEVAEHTELVARLRMAR